MARGKVGGSFPHFWISSVVVNLNEKRNKRKEVEKMDIERKKGGEKKREIFLVFPTVESRRSES